MNSEKEIILSATDKANKRELSFEEANDIVSKYPQSHRAHALLAFLYLQRNEFEKVVEQIKESLKYGESVTAFNLSAHANIKLKNNEAAKADYLSALELDANDYMSMANYAVFQGQMGEFEEAINTIRRLTLLKPNDLAMKTKLVTMYLTISDFEGAANYLEDVIKEFPNEYIFQHMLGNAYYQSDRKEKAVEYYKNAIKIKPDAAKSYLNIAQYHYENEDYSQAISLLEKAMEIDPEWRASYIQMCYIYYRQNNFSYLKEFIPKNEDHLKTSVEAAAISELVAVQEGEKTVHPYCSEPLNYITEFHIKDYIKDHEIFMDKLKEEIDTLEFHEGFAPQSGKSQINGSQTIGNIFLRQGELLNELREFFLKAVDDYKKKHKSSDNLLIKGFPEDIKLYGWSTKFDKGSGNHFSHLHPTGWISGSFYLNVPNDIKSHEANIQFDVQGQLPLFNDKIKIETKNIMPEVGKLIIFPSSLYHCTTPFSSKESYRQALNFDLVSPYVIKTDIGI
tara:strand:- start:59 stop:1582 length:1524 start_codon:yes stop_codon:yes gene_type:complete